MISVVSNKVSLFDEKFVIPLSTGLIYKFSFDRIVSTWIGSSNKVLYYTEHQSGYTTSTKYTQN